MKYLQFYSTTISDEAQLKIRFYVKRNKKIAYEKVIDANSGDDFQELCEKLAKATGQALGDVEQSVAETVASERSEWLKARDGGGENPEAGRKPDDLPYLVIDGATEGFATAEDQWGIWAARKTGPVQLTNFDVTWSEEVTVLDGDAAEKTFVGEVRVGRRSVPFRIPAKGWADNKALKAALTEACGADMVFDARPEEFRNAVALLNKRRGTMRRKEVSADFGWAEDRTAYWVQGGRITADGFQAVEGGVDLSWRQNARYLDLKPLPADELARVKRHVAQDLLRFHRPEVTYALLGAAAAAVLQRFATAQPFALWLLGDSGVGKSYAAKLFSNLFGGFGLDDGRFANWNDTVASAEQEGYYFKDATYLVDDYKPECARHGDVIKLLQNYSERKGRARLSRDANPKASRPIRGLLVCTAEDLPEHTASALARTVFVRVPGGRMDKARKTRCEREWRNYPGVTADFIRWVLAGERGEAFAGRFEELQAAYYEDASARPNAMRVASNLALLGAAFEQFADYLGDVWADREGEKDWFTGTALVGIRDEMLGEVADQQPGEVFLRTLGDLITNGYVGLADSPSLARGGGSGSRQQVRRVDQGRAVGRTDSVVVELSLSLALGEVNAALRQQGKPELKVTLQNLRQQLEAGGRLLTATGRSGDRVRIGGQQVRVVRVSWDAMFGAGEGEAGEGQAPGPAAGGGRQGRAA